ncbi:hypothetical protein Shal_2467 [Shewanella halifaxensis HAW-EB4]|uniref:Uncharacterized protein n=1 Tax=Shewanella halifaxensis (strain HAW-EB4) TaxID=458817 RepID=B0TJM9_SHEHH|nr:hypothetical protein [Shewanella halifaxensis]ABZ77025.1 hypothetical protein Shal_2467 [Shewanella halifaxensis HAW-EB4]
MFDHLEFKAQLPLIDKALTFLAVVMCVSGLLFIIKSNASELSVMTMIASTVIALSIYLFKVLVIGLSQSVASISDGVQVKYTTPKPKITLEQRKVASFGLCTFCNQFETKNTLAGRYVCSDCYQVFLKVKGQVLVPNISPISSVTKAS